MRQDMKVGFAIGGVLLAVLVVYVLAVSGHDKKKQQAVTLATSSDSTNTQGFTADQPGITQVKTETPSTDAPAATKQPEVIPPAVPGLALNPTTGPSTSTPEQTASRGSGSDDRWSAALNTGKLPLMETSTPMRMSTVGEQTAQPEEKKIDINLRPNGGETASNTNINSEPQSLYDRPTTAPSSGDRTHKVASGETLSSIATMAYGSSALYPRILAANPNVDPKKLKVGQVLNLPPMEEAADKATTPDSALMKKPSDFTPSKAIDDKTQYVVQSGDSLYRISVKLYGKADHIDKLFEANKGKMASPQALRTGMVLTLPEPPTSRS